MKLRAMRYSRRALGDDLLCKQGPLDGRTITLEFQHRSTLTFELRKEVGFYAWTDKGFIWHPIERK